MMLGSNRASSSNSSQAAGSLKIKSEVRQLNDSIFELHTPHGTPNLEFVFFHGLYEGNSNDQDPYLWTWESGDGTCIWPQTWLVDEFPQARIRFVSYRGKVGKGCHGRHDMYTVGENLAFDMIEANVGQTPNCPVVLVGHCFGGLVLKQLCLQVNEKKGLTRNEGERAKLQLFLGNIKRIFYYGTPHYGNRMIDKVTYVLKDPLLSYFETLSTEGSRLNSRFDQLCGVYPAWRAHSLGESLPSESGLFKGVVAAPEASARHGEFNLLATDHTSICKPKSKTDMRFYALTNLVKSIESNFEDLSLCVHECRGLPSYGADMERRAGEVEEKLKGVFYLGLVGMGGIGKTTLAKQVFNNISRQFEYTCFVDNVKGIEKHELEERLLSTFHHNGKSTGKIDWWQLKGKRTLLVMDDLDSSTQLKLVEPLSFGINSHVIITTRDRGVLNSVNRQIMDIYDVDFLQMDDAKKLFCQHAGIDQISDEAFETNVLKEKVEAVVQRCGGLPLTLEVMGSYLRDHVTDAVYWEQTIDKLVTGQSINGVRHDEVWASLRISYDALVQEEQDLFTEAATLFFEKPLNGALAAWSSAYGNSETRWANLVRKSLVKEMVRTGFVSGWEGRSEYKSVWVHEQLRGLAKTFKMGDRVIERSTKNNEIVDLLNRETVKAEAKSLKLSVYYYYRRCRWSLCDCCPLYKGQTIQVNQLARLKRLKYLELDGYVLRGSGKYFPRELYILRVTHRGRFILPVNLQEMNNLAVLELENCKIPEKFVEGLGNLDKLRILSLWSVYVIKKLRIFSVDNFQSGVIRRLPETFGNLPRLKELTLKNLKLEELPESFGHLSALERLTLVGLKISRLPKSFVELAALQSLTIQSDSLECLPESFGRLFSLRTLLLSGSGIENLPTSFGQLFALQYLQIKCRNLKKLPDGFENLSSLEVFECWEHFLVSSLKPFPEGSFEFFALGSSSETGLETLPENFARLTSLRSLILHAEVKNLPNNFGELFGIQHLALDCPNLESLPNTFGNLSSLEKFVVSTPSLKSFPECVGQLSSLRKLEFVCHEHERLPDGLAHLSSFLHELSLIGGSWSPPRCSGWWSSRIFPGGLGVLSSLRILEIKRFWKLESLPEELGELSSLQTLNISYCSAIESLPGSLARISSLKDVHLSSCRNFKSLPNSWGKPSSLKQLTLPEGDGIQDLKRSAVGEESSMTTDMEGMRIHFEDCSSLDESAMTNLGWLLEPSDPPYRKTYRRPQRIDSTS